jgi:hypothetical protein
MLYYVILFIAASFCVLLFSESSINIYLTQTRNTLFIYLQTKK